MSPIMAQPSALQRLGDTPATQDLNLKPPGTAAPRGTFLHHWRSPGILTSIS
jgi:hypothetical protein